MTSTLARTPFYDFHVEHEAKMVEYAGWEMPIRYTSIREEHQQVRTSGGLFDVSHMGRFRFKGRDACRFLDRVYTRQVHGMPKGAARYGLVCNEQGGCHDDVLVYHVDDGEYAMVCNAANRAKLLTHFDAVRGDLVFQFKDETESTAMVALQGPKVMELMSNFSSEVPALKRYRFTVKNLLMAKFMISRTGYTGEDGVEVILPKGIARKAVAMMVSNLGPDSAIKPCGLGARDSLRLEAGMALYGHEISEKLDPISAGLDFAIKLTKGEDDPEVERFIGQDALQRIKADGPARRLVGLVLDTRRSARQDMIVRRDGADVGFVTSGCLSPTLDKSIAMAYVDTGRSEEGATLTVDLGRQEAEATIVPLPFYKSS